MLLNRSPHTDHDDDLELVVDGLVPTHWVLAICAECGHEQPRAEHSHRGCPGCGAQLRHFALHRALRADA
jgi:hypothetical protein